MEDFKQLVSSNNVLQLSKALQKIEKVIEQQKKDSTKKESAIEELNFLKEQCLSDNVQLSILSCQALYHLVESGVLEPANALTMFITMLSNANTSAKMSAIGEGVVNVLLLDLKFATMRMKSSDSYKCPFGMKNALHPIVTLMYKKNVDQLELANKLNGICNHSDVQIRSNSIEFLRPVFLHALCNPNKAIDTEPIWLVLLKQHRDNSAKTTTLLGEVFAWSRITSEKCLSFTLHLIDVIEFYLETDNIQNALEYQMVLTRLVLSLIEFGYDPRSALGAILKTIQQTNSQSIDNHEIFDYILITSCQIIHNIAPFYLGTALDVIKALIDQNRVGNIIIRNMLLDSLIIQLAINGKIIRPQVAKDIEQLIRQLRKLNKNADKAGTLKESKYEVKYFDPMIATNINLVRLSTNLSIDLANMQTKRLNRLIHYTKSKNSFTNEMHFLVRSLLLSMEDATSFDVWLDILKILIDNISTNTSCDAIYFVLHLLAKEADGRKQMELLRALVSFAVIKENIPLILNTYRSLSASSSAVLRIISIDLHTRLWLAENRTYQFLHKVLIADDDNLSKSYKWEMNVVKAYAIKTICSHKASLHGTDLVAPLSKILNSSVDNDLASSLALDAVVWLCKSHTVNIVSTWKVLRGVFESNLQTRTRKSLCAFYGEVPLLRSPSNDYDLLFREALDRLWNLVTNSIDIEIIKCALRALWNFDFTELTLQNIPSAFYDSIKLPKEYQIQIAASHSDPDNPPLTAADVVPYIPGECWIELLQNIHQDVSDDAIEFVIHLIDFEISQYRSGVYMLADGRPEPKELQHLHVKSPLRAIIKFLIEQSESKAETAAAVKCLRCISQKYSRPIPPLNWFFLIEYINQAEKFEYSTADDQFKMKKYALTIAGNQIAHSGSAKTIVENYLQTFDAGVKDFEEIELAMNLLTSICDGVSPQILATFIHQTLDFVYAQSSSSNFEENCHFQVAIVAIAKVFDKKCLISENIDILTDEMCRFNNVLPINSKIYEIYSSNLLKLSSDSLERFTTPNEWNNDIFKKTLTIRTKAILSRKPFTTTSNAWMWFNALVDNVSDSKDPISDNERKELLLSKLATMLTDGCDESTLSEWIMFYLGKVQSNFNQESSMTRSLFSLDIFIFCIVTRAGCAIYVDDELSMKNQSHWLDKFPEALWLLSKRSAWTSHMPRIFEFLYHLNTQQTHLPKEYASIIRDTLICVKNNEYFLQKSNWTKFIALN